MGFGSLYEEVIGEEHRGIYDNLYTGWCVRGLLGMFRVERMMVCLQEMYEGLEEKY